MTNSNVPLFFLFPRTISNNTENTERKLKKFGILILILILITYLRLQQV